MSKTTIYNDYGTKSLRTEAAFGYFTLSAPKRWQSFLRLTRKKLIFFASHLCETIISPIFDYSLFLGWLVYSTLVWIYSPARELFPLSKNSSNFAARWIIKSIAYAYLPRIIVDECQLSLFEITLCAKKEMANRGI